MVTPALTTVQEYEFDGGFPTLETIQRAYDDADLNRAITAYRFFYPSVSGMCVYNGNIDSGMVPNRVFCVVRDRDERVHDELRHSVRRHGARPVSGADRD